MTDKQWKRHVKTLNEPIALLEQIVQSVDQGLFGHDPYYADLKSALISQAEKVISKVRKEK